MAVDVTKEQQKDDVSAEKVEASTEKVEASVENVSVSQPKSKTWIWVTLIVLLIFIIAGAGFYYVLQLKNEQSEQKDKITNEKYRVIELTKQLTSVQSQLASFQSQLATVGKDMTGTDNSFNKKLAEYSNLHNKKLAMTHGELKQNILQLQRQLGKTRGDWLMSDAEYLLSVANQRLHLMGDIKTTREALIAADKRLLESGDGQAFKVRDQIKKELIELKAVPVDDIVGHHSSLQVLIDKIDDLDLLLPYADKPLTPSKEEGLSSYIAITHSKDVVDKVLTPIQASFIKQQLGIKLETVKIALVQKNKSLYSVGVKDSLAWLKANFRQNNKTALFTEELTKLSSLKIDRELPNIGLSLNMLRDIAKLRVETDKALEEKVSADTALPSEKLKPPVEEAKEKTSSPTTDASKKEAADAAKKESETSSKKEDEKVGTDKKIDEKKAGIEKKDETKKTDSDKKTDAKKEDSKKVDADKKEGNSEDKKQASDSASTAEDKKEDSKTPKDEAKESAKTDQKNTSEQ